MENECVVLISPNLNLNPLQRSRNQCFNFEKPKNGQTISNFRNAAHEYQCWVNHAYINPTPWYTNSKEQTVFQVHLMSISVEWNEYAFILYMYIYHITYAYISYYICIYIIYIRPVLGEMSMAHSFQGRIQFAFLSQMHVLAKEMNVSRTNIHFGMCTTLPDCLSNRSLLPHRHISIDRHIHIYIYIESCKRQ